MLKYQNIQSAISDEQALMLLKGTMVCLIRGLASQSTEMVMLGRFLDFTALLLNIRMS